MRSQTRVVTRVKRCRLKRSVKILETIARVRITQKMKFSVNDFFSKYEQIRKLIARNCGFGHI